MSLQVSVQQRYSENIQVPSRCKLFEDQSYTLHCSQAIKIQPKVRIWNKRLFSAAACWHDASLNAYRNSDTSVSRVQISTWSLDQITSRRLRSACRQPQKKWRYWSKIMDSQWSGSMTLISPVRLHPPDGTTERNRIVLKLLILMESFFNILLIFVGIIHLDGNSGVFRWLEFQFEF